MFPVSVTIVAKNEEENIEDALKSVAGAEEIIVVDAFSTDKTVEICKAYIPIKSFSMNGKDLRVKNRWPLIMQKDRGY